jgi:hypothetical protein
MQAWVSMCMHASPSTAQQTSVKFGPCGRTVKDIRWNDLVLSFHTQVRCSSAKQNSSTFLNTARRRKECCITKNTGLIKTVGLYVTWNFYCEYLTNCIKIVYDSVVQSALLYIFVVNEHQGKANYVCNIAKKKEKRVEKRGYSSGEHFLALFYLWIWDNIFVFLICARLCELKARCTVNWFTWIDTQYRPE